MAGLRALVLLFAALDCAQGGQEPDSATTVVTVLAADTGEPIAGAEVEFLFSRTFWRAQAGDSLRRIDRAREAAVERARTGEDGTVRVRRTYGLAWFSASTPGFYAETESDVELEERVTLRLAPDRALVVDVRDSSGRAVEGVPLLLSSAFGPKRNTLGFADAFPPVARARSDSKGRATFEHVQRATQSKLCGGGRAGVDVFRRLRDQGAGNDSGHEGPAKALEDIGRLAPESSMGWPRI